MDTYDQDLVGEFKEMVNMSAQELDAWLKTEESRAVGQQDGGHESVGHRSGQRIVEILQKDSDDYSDADLAHMRKVIGYIHRHLAQRPKGEVSDTPWRHSLMNWGHDPERTPRKAGHRRKDAPSSHPHP